MVLVLFLLVRQPIALFCASSADDTICLEASLRTAPRLTHIDLPSGCGIRALYVYHRRFLSRFTLTANDLPIELVLGSLFTYYPYRLPNSLPAGRFLSSCVSTQLLASQSLFPRCSPTAVYGLTTAKEVVACPMGRMPQRLAHTRSSPTESISPTHLTERRMWISRRVAG